MISTSKKSIAFGILFAGILASVAAVLQSGWTSTTNPATARTALAVPGLAVNNSFSSISPITTLAESWIGPSSTAGIYFKSGNVGIGTTAPGGKLQVVGASTVASGVLSTSPGLFRLGSADTELAIGVDSTLAGRPNWLQGRHPSVDSLYYDLALNPLGGNVGIGTTTPTSGRLVVDGGGITFGTDDTYNIGASGANRPNKIFVGTGDSIFMGNLGIKMVPGRPLDVEGTVNVNNGVYSVNYYQAMQQVGNRMLFGNGNAGFPDTTELITEGIVRLHVDKTNSYFINTTNVGIGTQTPSSPLHVVGDSNIRINIAQFDVTITDFVIGTRYTNSNRRSFVAASFQLAAAVAGTAAVTFSVEQAGTTNNLTVSSGPLAGLTTIEPLALPVGPGAFYYFTDTSSGAGAVASIVAGTSSQTGF